MLEKAHRREIFERKAPTSGNVSIRAHTLLGTR